MVYTSLSKAIGYPCDAIAKFYEMLFDREVFA
jgi:hypothetical protein